MMQELEHLPCEEWLRELGLFRLQAVQTSGKKARMDLIHALEHLKEMLKEDRAGIFSGA